MDDLEVEAFEMGLSKATGLSVAELRRTRDWFQGLGIPPEVSAKYFQAIARKNGVDLIFEERSEPKDDNE